MGHKQKHGKVDAAAVLRVFRHIRKPLGRHELFRALQIGKPDGERLYSVLDQLVAEGKVMRLRGGAWGLAEHLHMVTGELQIQRSGVAFLLPEDKRRKDIFVARTAIGEAWHGDRVTVAVLPGDQGKRQGKRQEGRVVRILERGLSRIPVRVVRRMGKGMTLCVPTDPRQPMQFLVEAGVDGVEPVTGDLLVVEPGERVERDLWAGTVLERLGPEDDVEAQEALVKLHHRVPTDFPSRVLEEAAEFPEQPLEVDFEGRRDLRELGLITIDGANAKDFDDAVYVEETGSGFRLVVAIADVAHYVQAGSALDREAEERGNSYYFPRSVEPMLPHALSNGLCSLNLHVPRLAVAADMELDSRGAVQRAEFYPAVIRSAARLTYAQVNRALFLGDEEERARVEAVLPMLERAERLARLISERRKERGSLDFDLPEPEIQFNLCGEAVDIRPSVRHFGHQIIEEFMIAANEAVARFFEERSMPCLYRVHEAPDPVKLEALFRLLGTTELAGAVPSDPTVKSLQALLTAAEGTDLEFMVGRLVLRTMMQAKYSPENVGHFGLASECYCHFTSPIRRYADLEVHRVLKAVLKRERIPAPTVGLVALCENLSVRERVAMGAEREIMKRVTILFLRDRVGEELTGVVNSLSEYGFWVELKEVMAEGMVRLSTMRDDYYDFIPERQELRGQRTGKRFQLGQTVRVRLTDVDLGRLEVNLDLLTQENGENGEDGEKKELKNNRKPRPRQGKEECKKEQEPGKGKAKKSGREFWKEKRARAKSRKRTEPGSKESAGNKP